MTNAATLIDGYRLDGCGGQSLYTGIPWAGPKGVYYLVDQQAINRHGQHPSPP